MRVKKKVMIGVLAGVLCIGSSFSAMAGSWQEDSVGWWWQDDNGTYPVNTWKWIDGNSDGIAECYYFNSNGYCLMNAETPDGYQVDPSGAWVINGVVQKQALPNTISKKETETIYQKKLSQCKSKFGNSVLYEAEYLIWDFNQDSIQDLLLLERRRTEDGFYTTAELYTIVNGNLSVCDRLVEEEYSDSPFLVSRKDGYILVSYSAGSDTIWSITSSLTFMQEVNYSPRYDEIFQNANHIYRGCVSLSDIDEGTEITMTSLNEN